LKSNTWELGNALGYLGFSSQTGTFQAENLNIQGGTSNVLTIAGNTQIYPTEGTMEFTPDVDNAYLAYVPYGDYVGGRYYHPLRDDIPGGSGSMTIGGSGSITMGGSGTITLGN
jgi:hypothetical protein